MRTTPRALVLAGLCASALGALRAGPETPFVSRPAAKLETAAAGAAGDSYDDPAVWVHPDEPARSLVLGTNKKGGLHVFDMAGRQLQVVSPTARPDNVDVLYGFPLEVGRADLAVAGCREPGRPCVRVWRIDPDRRALTELTGPAGIPVFGGKEPYGSCTYRSPRTGRFYFFVNEKSGGYEQYELTAQAAGLAATRVRAFQLDSVAEGCVADEEAGTLYAAEEAVGVWRLGAEPDAGGTKTLVAKVGENGLTADVEGVTLYHARAGGYLIVSSQGSNTYKVYDRRTGAFAGTVAPSAGPLGGVADTDGITVTNRPTSAAFPKGVLVVQDGTARPGGQRFKLFAWEDVAGGRLVVDPDWDARPAVTPR